MFRLKDRMYELRMVLGCIYVRPVIRDDGGTIDLIYTNSISAVIAVTGFPSTRLVGKTVVVVCLSGQIRWNETKRLGRKECIGRSAV